MQIDPSQKSWIQPIWMSYILDTWGWKANRKHHSVFKEELGKRTFPVKRRAIYCYLHHPCSRMVPNLSREREMTALPEPLRSCWLLSDGNRNGMDLCFSLGRGGWGFGADIRTKGPLLDFREKDELYGIRPMFTSESWKAKWILLTAVLGPVTQGTFEFHREFYRPVFSGLVPSMNR